MSIMYYIHPFTSNLHINYHSVLNLNQLNQLSKHYLLKQLSYFFKIIHKHWVDLINSLTGILNINLLWHKLNNLMDIIINIYSIQHLISNQYYISNNHFIHYNSHNFMDTTFQILQSNYHSITFFQCKLNL